MAVIKTKKGNNPFVQIDHRPLNDARLSWRARGILAYLLSKPHDWKIITENLISQGTEGRDAVKTAFQELKELGYASIEIHRDEITGKVSGSSWTITELPHETDKLENRVTGKPGDWKSATTNKDCSNKEETTNKDLVLFSPKTEFPEALNVPEFLEAWKQWEEHLKEKRSKLTPQARKNQVGKCQQWGLKRSIRALEHSIGQNYRGLYESPAEAKYGVNKGIPKKNANGISDDSFWHGELDDVCRMWEEDGEKLDVAYLQKRLDKVLEYTTEVKIWEFVNKRIGEGKGDLLYNLVKKYPCKGSGE